MLLNPLQSTDPLTDPITDRLKNGNKSRITTKQITYLILHSSTILKPFIFALKYVQGMHTFK